MHACVCSNLATSVRCAAFYHYLVQAQVIRITVRARRAARMTQIILYTYRGNDPKLNLRFRVGEAGSLVYLKVYPGNAAPPHVTTRRTYV